MPVGQVVGGNQVVPPQAIDPVTGYPLQGQSNGVGQAPIDANTGLPMTLVVDPATGQQVWVPSAPAQQQQIQPPANLGQPVPIENERSQRTLMDLIFGDQQN
jgi:penicillin-binding protein 1A